MTVDVGNNPVASLGGGPVLPVIGYYQYDLALRDYLTLEIYPDPNDPNKTEKITVVPVTGPPRAEYATQTRIHEIPHQEADHLNETVALPAMALSRLDFKFQPARWTKANYRKLGYTEDGFRVIQSEEPMPFDVMYQLDIWAKYRSQLNQIIRKLALKFISRDVWLPVNLGGPWGERSIPVVWMEGPKDLTTLDHGEYGNIERKLRNVITFVMQGWIMPDPTSIPSVRKVTYVYYIQETGNLPGNNETIDLNTVTKIKEITLDSTIGLKPEEENP